MSHSTIIPITFGGRRMFVYCAIGGVAGVAADGPDAGTILWECTDWSNSVTAPSPVWIEKGRIFATAGYGAGSMIIQLEENNGTFKASSLARLEKSVFACEQQTPVFYEGYLYGILPSDGGALNRRMVCYHPDGKMAWSSGTTRFGLGPFMIADGKLLILSDDGVLTMAKASPDGYRQLASADILDGHEAWAPLALVEGRLLARDSKHMVCLDLRAN